jgi:hypothetical protein
MRLVYASAIDQPPSLFRCGKSPTPENEFLQGWRWKTLDANA